MTTTEQTDPHELSLDELRALRSQLQLEDDAVSYAAPQPNAFECRRGRRSEPATVGARIPRGDL